MSRPDYIRVNASDGDRCLKVNGMELAVSIRLRRAENGEVGLDKTKGDTTGYYSLRAERKHRTWDKNKDTASDTARAKICKTIFPIVQKYFQEHPELVEQARRHTLKEDIERKKLELHNLQAEVNIKQRELEELEAQLAATK
jgi:hypothetical protein